MGRVCGTQVLGWALHNTLHFIVQCIINMLCGLRESTEKLEVPANQLDLCRAFCMHLLISKYEVHVGVDGAGLCSASFPLSVLEM